MLQEDKLTCSFCGKEIPETENCHWSKLDNSAAEPTGKVVDFYAVCSQDCAIKLQRHAKK